METRGSPQPGEALRRAANLLKENGSSSEDPVLAGIKRGREVKYGGVVDISPGTSADETKSQGWKERLGAILGRGKETVLGKFKPGVQTAEIESEDGESQVQEKRDRSIKEMAQAIWDRSNNVKVFGKIPLPLGEIAVTGGLGFGTRIAIRAALGYLSVGGLGLPTLAGAAGGAVVEIFKRRQAEQRRYDDFINGKFKEFTEGEFDDKKMSNLIQEHQRIRTERDQATDKIAKEARSDEERYLRVLMKRREKGNMRDGRLLLDEFLKSEEGTKIVQDQTEAEKLVELIRYTDLVGFRRYLQAAGRGAVKGAAFGFIGGFVAEWIASGKFPIPLDKLTPANVEHAVKDVSDKLGEVGASSNVTPAASGVPIGTEGGGPSLGGTIPALTAEPELVKLPQGSNLWNESEKYLIRHGVPNPTNPQIMALDKALARAHGIAVPEWGIEGKILHTRMPVGTPINFGEPSVKAVFDQIQEGKLTQVEVSTQVYVETPPVETTPTPSESPTSDITPSPTSEIKLSVNLEQTTYANPLDRLTNPNPAQEIYYVSPELKTSLYEQVVNDLKDIYPGAPPEVIKRLTTQLAWSSNLQIGLSDQLPVGSKIVRDTVYRNLVLQALPSDISNLWSHDINNIIYPEYVSTSYYNEAARLAGKLLKRVANQDEIKLVAQALQKASNPAISIGEKFRGPYVLDEEVRKALRVILGYKP